MIGITTTYALMAAWAALWLSRRVVEWLS